MPEQTGAMNFLLSRCSHAALSELHLRVSVVKNVYLVVLVMTALSATSCNLKFSGVPQVDLLAVAQLASASACVSLAVGLGQCLYALNTTAFLVFNLMDQESIASLCHHNVVSPVSRSECLLLSLAGWPLTKLGCG